MALRDSAREKFDGPASIVATSIRIPEMDIVFVGHSLFSGSGGATLGCSTHDANTFHCDRE